jgi:DNA-directed RNA polymerase beta' subunit
MKRKMNNNSNFLFLSKNVDKRKKVYIKDSIEGKSIFKKSSDFTLLKSFAALGSQPALPRSLKRERFPFPFFPFGEQRCVAPAPPLPFGRVAKQGNGSAKQGKGQVAGFVEQGHDLILEKNKVLASSLLPNFSEQPALHVTSKNFSKYKFTDYSYLFKKSGETPFLGGSAKQENLLPKEERGKDGQVKARFYTSYSKLSEVKLLTIGIASPLRILQWAEKTLPNGKIYGEVLNANTLHHKTFKPQKGGLFCERIFGPLKDFECACGKVDKSVKKIQTDYKLYSLSQKKDAQTMKLVGQRKFCPDCDVEYTWSVIRRYQLGYIKLSSPVTHIWFLKGTPSYLSLLLDMKKRYLQFVTYCSETLTLEKSSLPFYSNTNKDYLEKFSFLGNKDSTLSPSVTSTSSNGYILPITKGSKEQTELNLPINTEVKKKERSKCVPKKGWHLHLNEFQSLSAKRKKDGLPSTFPLKETSGPAQKLSTYGVLHNSIKPFNKVSSKKGTFVLSTLLLSIYYKSLKNRNIKDKKILLPNFKTLFKKLPLDLYILCTLERMLHTSSINLSIQKGWEILYKKAFVKAINKANTILSKFITITDTDTDKVVSNKLSNLAASTSKKVKNPKTIILNNLQSIKKNSYSIQLNIKDKQALLISNKHLKNTLNRNEILLKNIKNKYINHAYKLLENLKYPILSLNYTTQFLQKNSLFQIQKKISLEIANYLLKNTEPLEKVLTQSLLNSLLLDQFINKKDFTITQPFSLTNNIENINKDKNKMLKYKSIIILNSLKKWKLNKGHYTNTPFSPTLSYLPQKVFSFPPFFPLPFSFPFGEQGTKGKEEQIESDFLLRTPALWEGKEREAKEKILPLLLPFAFRKSKESKKEKKESFIARSKEKEKEKGKLTFKKKIYNNVYTLSHRERWDNDKDWYVFSLFTFGITEFTDYPIYTYKDRLSSLIMSQDYSYLAQSQNKYEIEKSNKNSNFNMNTSYIYSSVFYSGAGIVQQLLNELNYNEMKKLDKQNRLLLYQLNKSILNLKKYKQIFIYDKEAKLELKELCKKRDLLIRRTKLVRKIFIKNTNPSSMVLTVIPVLPPDLRPIVKMGNQIAASDLNRLYQRVIYRNDRLKKFLKDPATSQSYEMKYAQRLLQEAVDNLMQNGKSGLNSEKDARGRALKSLSDILKGKQGRFRQFLLGKRVDYSGRSVIVVGPKLKLHECGLPVEMAKELYLPFLLKSILNKNYAKTVIGAKTLIKNNPSLANELLREIMQVTPVLLNRAPTLHRLGIQAFVPKLIEGRAILLHPLVCSAFNADFDGDQMAVHVPITVEARAEAWKIMLSRNNLLSTATGDPLAIPSQDMVLGCYYLTTYANKKKRYSLRGSGMYFNHLYDVIHLYEQQLIDIHALVWVKWTHLIQNGSDQESPTEIRISPFGQWQEITPNYQKMYDYKHNLINLYMCTTPGRILFNLIIQNIM